jgi:hypothetical protein
MIRPNDNVVKALALMVRQYPEVLEWFVEWQQSELERLPYAGENGAVQSGRSQVLIEQVKLLKQAPELAAKR